jgi:Ca2+-binding EF-hand superfamily protein
MDENGDGVVTRKEYHDYTSEWFREADTNHDGQLTFEEVVAQLKREKEKMRSERMHDNGTLNDGAMNNDANNENNRYNSDQYNNNSSNRY